MHERLERLRQKLAVTDDLDLREALEDKIAALEKKAGVVPAPPAGDTITVGNLSQVAGVAVGTGAHSMVIQLFFTAAGISDPSGKQRELVVAYLARLAQRCDRLRLSGAVHRERRDASTPPLTLSQVYVTLAAEVWEPVREADSEKAFAKDLAAGHPDDVLPEAARRIVELQREGELVSASKRGGKPRYRLERPLLLTETLSRRKQLVLLGGPGSGKSSFLCHLAVALATAGDSQILDLPGWSADRLLPIYPAVGAGCLTGIACRAPSTTCSPSSRSAPAWPPRRPSECSSTWNTRVGCYCPRAVAFTACLT